MAIATLVKQAKGVSAKFINEHLTEDHHFRWQSGYGAFSISRWDLPMIINYVKKQKEHPLMENYYRSWNKQGMKSSLLAKLNIDL